jgi:cell wall assembly regulator SMI1
MKDYFEQVEEKINLQELIDFEKEQAIELPNNYKKLILKYNGGYTENNTFFDTLKSIKYGNITVEKTINIHQKWEQNIPKNFFPIANDFSDNIICLNIEKGNDYGKVFIFYFDVNRTKKIADSLEELFGVNSIDEL